MKNQWVSNAWALSSATKPTGKGKGKESSTYGWRTGESLVHPKNKEVTRSSAESQAPASLPKDLRAVPPSLHGK